MPAESSEELARKLSALLGDPDSLDRLRSAAGAFGLGDLMPAASPSPPSKPDFPAPPPDRGNQPNRGGQPGRAGLPDLSGLPDLGALGNLLPLLKDFGKDDENTTLLRSLRPYLHGEREKRLDEAIKMLHLMRLLPLLQERGLF